MKKIFKRCLLVFFAVTIVLGHLNSLTYVVAESNDDEIHDSVVEEELLEESDSVDEVDKEQREDVEDAEPEDETSEESSEIEEKNQTEVSKIIEESTEIRTEDLESTENKVDESVEELIETDENEAETTVDDNREKYEIRLFFHIGKDDLSIISEAFQELLNTYNELTPEERVENIYGFQLYTNNEGLVQSRHADFNPTELGAQENEDLVSMLNAIRLTEGPPAMSMMSRQVSTSVSNTSTIDRLVGQDRVEVAINVSRKGWSSSDTVVIANGYRFTDALSGTPLAAHYNAPMLLVDGNSITNATLNEINRLKAKNIIILGGTSSVPERISNTLKNRGLSVRRIAGENRYDTSRKIAEELISKTGPSSAHLVNGDAYADAVSISSVAGRYKHPILLTRANELHPEVKQVAKSVKDWRVIGGTTSISSNTERQLNGLVNSVFRLSGANRYEVNRRVLNHWGISGKQIYVGHGDAFADVLTTSVLASKQNTGVLLVSGNQKDISDAQNYARARQLTNFTLLGGNRTITNRIINAFENLYKVIFVDPGHGGTDPGARGNLNGKTINEKDLNLSMSLKLRDRLRAQGYTVLMSREKDVTIAMVERARMANNTNADIFVSVHHNSMGAGNAGVHGIETIYYTAHSNWPPLINKAMHNNPHRIAESKKLAHNVQDGMIARTGAHYRRVFGGAYVVVRETTMPAIIPELGFMSNTAELRKITNSSYQEQLLNGLVNGINDYFNN